MHFFAGLPKLEGTLFRQLEFIMEQIENDWTGFAGGNKVIKIQ